MTEHMTVLIGQMEILASLIAMGFFAQRAKLLNDENIDNFSAVLTRLIIPSMLITMVGNGGTRAELFQMWKFFLCVVGMLTFCILVGFGISRVIGLKQPTKNMHILVTSFGNGGFIGIPLLAVMYPEKSGLVGAVFLLVEATICWVVGPLLADTTTQNKKIDLKKLISPLTIAIVSGFVLIVFNVSLKGIVLWDTISAVGATTKYFAAIYIGLDLGRKGFGKIFANPKVFISTPFKLIIFPILAYIVFGKTGILQGDELTMLVLLIATPTGMAVPIIAGMAGSDQGYATAGTMINTLLCLLTIPFVMWVTLNF